MTNDKLSRRQFLNYCSVLGLTGFLPACNGTQRPLPECTTLEHDVLVPGQRRSLISQPYVGFDVHCHIFNGHDVPLSEFLTGPVLHFNPVLDALLSIVTEAVEAGIRLFAKSAAEEYAELCDLISRSKAARSGAPHSIVSQVRQEISDEDEKFTTFMTRIANEQKEFRNLYRTLEAQELERFGVPRSDLHRSIDPIRPDEIRRALQGEPAITRSLKKLERSTRASRIWPFLRRFWARRYHNAFRLIELYGSNRKQPDINVFFAALVDYDVPLKASPKSSRLEDQLQLMEAITVVTGGRVLPLVPFDPWRDVDNDGESFEIVQKAVLDYGCVGIKVYPPMGFKVAGNTNQDADCKWPNKEYGKKLDESLNRLYKWCRDEEVPILAHSSESNGLTKACQKSGGPEDWKTALSNWPGLQAYVGHFGGESKAAEASHFSRTKGFVKLMEKPFANNFYADVSYLTGLSEQNSELAKVVTNIITSTNGNEVKVVDRLMYGSDWFMIAAENAGSNYPVLLHKYFKAIGGEPFVQKIFSDNVIRFFRLAKPENNQPGKLRNRLDKHFARHDLKPDWLKKLDQPTVS